MLYDALRGNFSAIARCLKTGVRTDLLSEARAEFLRQRPSASTDAADLLSRAAQYEALGAHHPIH